MRNEGRQAVAEKLREASRIAVVAHLNPDGDCIGSALAMQMILRAMGKQADAFDRDKMPDILRTLAGVGEIRPLQEARGPYDVLLCVDCADLSRIVDAHVPEQKAWLDALIAASACMVQIDHHPSNPGYADVNWVDGEAAAACVMVYDLMTDLGVEPTREIAECLYAGISTDTGNFLQDNTNEDALRVVAALQKTGFNQGRLGRTLFAERRPEQVALISRALQTLRYGADCHATCMVLTRKDFDETGALPEDADTIVNFGRDIRGVHMALLARETEDGTKMSLRSIYPYHVVEVARAYGGGGHDMAAGCTVRGMGPEEAAERVFAAMQASLREQMRDEA